jgi:hypothetical protein
MLEIPVLDTGTLTVSLVFNLVLNLSNYLNLHLLYPYHLVNIHPLNIYLLNFNLGILHLNFNFNHLDYVRNSCNLNRRFHHLHQRFNNSPRTLVLFFEEDLEGERFCRISLHVVKKLSFYDEIPLWLFNETYWYFQQSWVCRQIKEIAYISKIWWKCKINCRCTLIGHRILWNCSNFMHWWDDLFRSKQTISSVHILCYFWRCYRS